MILSVTQFAAEAPASGIGALGIDLKALVIQLITFLLAFIVLKKWAFGPILAVMDQRRKTIEQGVELGEKMKKDEAALQSRIAESLSKARQEADSIIAQSHDSGRQIITDAEAKATAKAESVMQDAENRISQEAARVRKQLEKELVGLISDATEVIIDEKVDAKKDAALIDKALRQTAGGRAR
jgi:F-type H+-transporting ATPase subunit b